MQCRLDEQDPSAGGRPRQGNASSTPYLTQIRRRRLRRQTDASRQRTRPHDGRTGLQHCQQGRW